MKADFYYECQTCKVNIPATWGNVDPEGMQSVTVVKKETTETTETTFRCSDHHEPEPT